MKMEGNFWYKVKWIAAATYLALAFGGGLGLDNAQSNLKTTVERTAEVATAPSPREIYTSFNGADLTIRQVCEINQNKAIAPETRTRITREWIAEYTSRHYRC